MAAFRLAISSGFRINALKPRRITACVPFRIVEHTHPIPILTVAASHRTIISAADSAKEKSAPAGREYSESQDPEEWKYVERLIPPVVVPEPVLRDSYPSGWIPPTDESLKYPYFIGRSKNHMPSVYLRIGHRGIGKRTFIRKIKGDIWALERDLKEYLVEKTGKIIITQVNEMCGYIVFRGDYVLLCLDWVKSKGF
ncbi:Uncharacterized protein GBIM_15529 [Gryllus bimaculatus]|nr:Uncharacterized protein GBIM_15529 [Gryllus bimaculatus]